MEQSVLLSGIQSPPVLSLPLLLASLVAMPLASAQACVDLSGVYRSDGEPEKTLSQVGCSGQTSGGMGGWPYTVSGSTISSSSRSGRVGTISGLPGSYTIVWQSGRIWTEQSQGSLLNVEQLHVSVVGEARVVVSWASPSGAVANLTIEEVTSSPSGQPFPVAGSQQVIVPSTTSYTLKNADLRLGPPDLYSSPLLLHAEVQVRPSRMYRYCVGDAGGLGGAGLDAGPGWRTFRSPPAAGAERLRMAVVGDIGQTEFSRQTCRSLAQAHRAHALDVAVLVGDLAYADGNSSRWDSFGRVFDEAGCAEVPWLVIPGNHELDPDEISGEPFLPYRRRWRTPEAKPEEVGNDFKVFDWDTYDFRIRYDFGGSFWAVRLGPVHFVALNPYTSAAEDSPQIQWLDQELARVNRSTTPYLLALTHAPWRTSSKKHLARVEKATQRLREAAEGRLESAGADLVLAGHVHAYERTKPIQGARHLTLGHGGNYEKLYDEWQDMPYSEVHQGVHYGWGEIDFWRDAYSLLVRRSSDNAVIDSLVAARPSLLEVHGSEVSFFAAERKTHGHAIEDIVIATLVACLILILLACLRTCVLRRSRAQTNQDEKIGFKASPERVGASIRGSEE